LKKNQLLEYVSRAMRTERRADRRKSDLILRSGSTVYYAR